MVDALETPMALHRLPEVLTAEPPRLRALSHLRPFRREQDIYVQEERTDTWYRVVSGGSLQISDAYRRAPAACRYLPAGRSLLVTARLLHRSAVQAVTEGTLIACYPRHRVEALADEDAETAIEIRIQIVEALERLQEQLLVTTTMTAQKKVREFLFYFHRRLSAGTCNGLALPISR